MLQNITKFVTRPKGSQKGKINLLKKDIMLLLQKPLQIKFFI